MTKFAKLNYSEIKTKKVSDFETSFEISPLERGFGITLGNALRRVLLSSVSGVAPFAVKIENVDHEFQTLNGVTEDVVQIILNLKDVRFIYNTEIFKDGEVIKVSLKSKKGEVTGSNFILPAGVEMVDTSKYIATTNKKEALNLELFLIAGRGFVSFEENKTRAKELSSKIETEISNGSLIAIDSDFSPIKNVSYESLELNSSSTIIEEKMIINVKTDGSIDAKTAISQASHILMSHLNMLADLSNLEKDEIFEDDKNKESENVIKSIPISQLDLSVRSYNCLRRAGFETLEDLSKLTLSELQTIKNLGKKSIEEIIERLAKQEIVLVEDN